MSQSTRRKRTRMKGGNKTVAVAAFEQHTTCKMALLSLLLLSFTSAVVQGEIHCEIASNRCTFPFEFEGLETSCIKDGPPLNNTFSCKTVYSDGHWSWNECGSGCLNPEDKLPIEFTPENKGEEIFCKGKVRSCVFPFVFEGQEYNECTKAKSDSKWCATMVDESGSMIPGMWGECNESSCFEKVSAEATVEVGPETNQNGVSMVVKFDQKSKVDPVRISGTIRGLKEGKHGLHVHEKPASGDRCDSAGPHFNPEAVDHGGVSGPSHAGDLGNVMANAEGVAEFEVVVTKATIFEGQTSILNRTLVVHELADDLGSDPSDPESLKTGNAGRRVACGVISPVAVTDRKLTYIIIGVLVLVLIVNLIFCTWLLCYCCKKKKKQDNNRPTKGKSKPGASKNGFRNGRPSRHPDGPYGDDLSLPFIDDTPSASPKVGRSTDRLSFFNSRSSSIGRSRGSLSNQDDSKC